LLDRIDIHIEAPAVPYKELADRRTGTSSALMREGVVVARNRQRTRFENSKCNLNGRMSSRQVREFCQLSKESQALLKQSVQEFGLSARAHDKVLRVARTIADLDAIETIRVEHIQEAVNYRLLDRSPAGAT